MKKVLALTFVAALMLFVAGCTPQTDPQPVYNTNVQSSADSANKAQANTDKTAIITKDEAKQVALKHAGFDETQVKFLRAEYDYDNGRETYEVEFTKDKYEYDYEIDAVSGEILSFDKDFD